VRRAWQVDARLPVLGQWHRDAVQAAVAATGAHVHGDLDALAPAAAQPAPPWDEAMLAAAGVAVAARLVAATAPGSEDAADPGATPGLGQRVRRAAREARGVASHLRA
jgi:hypothetical protein